MSLNHTEQLQPTLLLGRPLVKTAQGDTINAVTEPMRHLPRVSVEVGRLDGSLDLVEDAQLLCHVQTLRMR